MTLIDDPWATEPIRKVVEYVALGDKMFSKPMVERAKKRIGDVRRESGRKFVVMGNDRFKDTYPKYDVEWLGGDEYKCSCWSLDHGETRKKRGCTHVLAVMLYRAKVAGSEAVPFKQRSLPESDPALIESGSVESESSPADDAVTPLPDSLTPTFDFIPSVGDPKFTAWDTLPLPPKFEAIHDHQWTAVCEAMELYQQGVELVYMDAPTGSGKTIIGELIRRLTQRLTFYICHSKTLQDQMVMDFPYAKVLKGRSNYPTQVGGPETTCADCTRTTPDDDCLWCIDPMSCSYQLAKAEAIRAKLAVLNTSYFLTESNYVGNVTKSRELGIVDECDTLESELMGFVEFGLSERMLQRVGLRAPKDGSHKTTIGKWLVDDLKPALHQYQSTIRGNDLRSIRDRMGAARLMADVLRIASQVERDEGLTGWVRDNKAGPLVLKPVVVSEYGDRYVWQHAQKWLCMSATIISADELSESCGVQGGTGEGEGGRRWGLVSVPMTFPVENRQIVVAPVADMSRKGKDAGEWEHAAKAIGRIVERHPGERILVHCVSYDLARFFIGHSDIRGTSRPLLSYTQASQRDDVLAKFRRTSGAVLFAASMDRGVDLAGDECLAVGSRVLMADLSWQPIEKVCVGDQVVAIEEHSVNFNGQRHLQYATVEATTENFATTIQVTTTRGTFRATANHPWLVMLRHKKQTEWRTTDKIRVGDRIRWVGPPSEPLRTWEAGWLAGFFDGEGCLSSSLRPDGTFSYFNLSFNQAIGPTLERAKSYLSALGFDYRVNRVTKAATWHKQVENVSIRGGFSEILRFLTLIRPERLINNCDLRDLTGGGFDAVVTHTEKCLAEPVFNLQTSAGTYIAEGMASHNCRVVICAKVPFPYLGDRQVAERLHMPGGQAWYSVQTIRKLIQMTGRAVRSKDDFAVSYILDRQFTKNVWSKNKGLLPEWWRQAVDTSFNVRELMR